MKKTRGRICRGSFLFVSRMGMAWGCFACGWDGKGDRFALRGDLLCPRRQSRQSAAGGRRLEKHSVFLCRLPRTPCFFYGGSHQGVWKNLSGAGKRQDTIPCAARCRSILLEQVLAPTRVVAPRFHPSRGGSLFASPPRLVPNMQDCRKHASAPGLHLPAVSPTAGPFQCWSFHVTVPRGYIQ